MLRVLRITLMWLMALAVPVQGYAAVAMLGCGPGHHGMTETSAQADTSDDHDAAAPMPLHQTGAGLAWVDAQHDSAVPAHAPMRGMHGTPGKIGKGACTTCASCCVVAALPAALPQFQPVPLVDHFVRSAPVGATAFLVEGPERPPRHLFS